MAVGLAQLADALDKAVSNATDGKPEPVLLGTAGRIASGLHQGMMEWLTENRTTLFGAYSSDRSRRTNKAVERPCPNNIGTLLEP
jgi:hypothetical protein